MESIVELIEKHTMELREFVGDLTTVGAEALGLDPRAGNSLYVCEDGIICNKYAQGSLEYYGGFEYVDRDFVVVGEEYVIYSMGDERVQRCLEYFEEEYNGDEE